MQGVFFVAACASVLAVALICIFLFANGIPAMKEIGFGKFLSGTLWRPKNEYLWYFPNDRRKSVCDRRSDYYRRADWNPDIRIYGTLLSEADLSDH